MKMSMMQNVNKHKQRIITVLLALALWLTVNNSLYAHSLTMDDFNDILSTYNIDDSIPGYLAYLASHEGAAYPETTLTVEASSFVRYEEDGMAASPEIFSDFEGMEGNSVLTSENSLIEFNVEVPESGLYNLSVVYYPVEGKNSDIQRSVFVDGNLPFQELSLMTFPRVWTSSVENTSINDNGIRELIWAKDNQGNDVKPRSVEIPEWQTRYLYDSKGYVTSPLYIYLEKGTRTISLLSLKEPMLINRLILDTEGRMLTYDERISQWNANGASDSSEQLIVIEGEFAAKTSSQMLYPRQNQSSPAISPASTKELLNNTIGGNSWRLVGQWIEWEFEVEEAGYYHISLFGRQNFLRGIDVSRRIYINGETPFEELTDYAFPYRQNWREDILKNEEGAPFRFYLEAGKNTLRMEAVLGDFSVVVGEVEQAVRELNDMYRQVIRITGVKPDTFRDYQIAAMLPELNAQLVRTRDILDSALAKLEAIAGRNTDKKTSLLTMRDQLNNLIKDEELFVRYVESYRINVRAVGNWITQVIEQPLEIDRIHIYSPDVEVKYEQNNFFSRLWYELVRLFYSFVIDYNQIGNVSDDKDAAVLTLWIGTGRDQANVIKSLIDESFTNKTGINVNVQLVDMSTLLRATLVGEGPDVAIQVANTATTGALQGSTAIGVGNDTPVNYGIRNAVLDLTQFKDIEEVSARFPDAAMTQFTFDGAVYALPETLTYPVMFYRRDILKEIGMDVPVTWDDVKVSMSVLAKNQMEFGMLPIEQLFASLLFQNGGDYYSEDGSLSALDSDIAVHTFRLYCEFYSDYKLDRDTSVEERFRTGECPLIISDYTTYNNFAVSAPDIAGLWGFTKIPGTVREDGTVDHSTAATGLASMIMSNTEYPDECWEFLKWWTCAETQTIFGREMESLMGSAARVPTANYEAFQNMPWPVEDFLALAEAKEWAKGLPQVPGGYYSWRNVNNAFFSVVVSNPDTSSPREELMDKVIYINAEIAHKRSELGLSVE